MPSNQCVDGDLYDVLDVLYDFGNDAAKKLYRKGFAAGIITIILGTVEVMIIRETDWKKVRKNIRKVFSKEES